MLIIHDDKTTEISYEELKIILLSLVYNDQSKLIIKKKGKIKLWKVVKNLGYEIA